jgi:hypothetical protein
MQNFRMLFFSAWRSGEDRSGFCDLGAALAAVSDRRMIDLNVTSRKVRPFATANLIRDCRFNQPK